MNSSEIFLELTAALDQARIPYMVVGFFAAPDQIRRFLSLFPEANYFFDLDSALDACRRKDVFNILDVKRGWKIDMIFEKQSAYHLQAFQRRTAAEIEHVPLFAATAENTVISKLQCAKMGESSRQIEDVAGILRVQESLLDRAYIEKWVRELELLSQWRQACKLAGFE